MSFTKKTDISENSYKNKNNDNKRRETSDYLNFSRTNSATTSAQPIDNILADIQTIKSFEKTPKDKCFHDCSQTDFESYESDSNELIVDQIGVKPILKRKSLDETEIKALPSILKKRDSFDSLSKHTILKRHSLGSETDQRNPSLLMTSTAVHEIDISSEPSSSYKPLSQIHSILKHKSFDEKFIQSKDDNNLPKPILKKNLSIEESIEKNLTLKNGTNGVNSLKASPSHSTNNSTKSILKSGSEEKAISYNKSVEMKSILKSWPKNNRNDSKPVKSALKKSDQSFDSKEPKVKSILKNESIGSNEEINTTDTSSSSSDEDFEIMSSLSQSNDNIESNNNNSTNIQSNNSNGSTVPLPQTCAMRQNDENRANQRHLFNNIRLDHKRPSSCIIMCSTEPIEIDIESDGRSITERLASLKQNGEECWKKRLQRSDETEVQLRVANNGNHSNRNRATSIADRVSLLEDSSLKWKNRVEEKDAKQFTIEAKMLKTETAFAKTPDVQRKTPKALPFRSEKIAQLLGSMKSEPMVPRVKISQIDDQKPLELIPKKTVVVSIPKSDDENFNSFFVKNSNKSEKNEKISDNVFDEISVDVTHLLIQKKLIKTHNRRTTSNPIRRLAARTDFIVESYRENTSNDSKSEDKKTKKSKDLVKSSSFAASALAGLASREDIKAIAGTLRSSSVITRDVWKSYDMPNSMQKLMLVQIKGRRRAQTRLVEPILDSINSGDSYILVTKDNLIVWIGQYSNIIERTKTLEIGNQIQENKDLCFRSSKNLILIDCQKPEKVNQKNNQLFLKELKSTAEQQINPPKPPEEDEVYEEVIIGTNMIYHVNNEQLVPNDSFWGRIPRYEMLTSDEAFVFDFGSEMYVWVGNKASNIKRKCALDSAKELWNKGYDYSDCDVNPFGEKTPKKAEKRPPWAWFMKVSQNMETVLFKDKFVNWPSTTTTSAVKSIPNEKQIPKQICTDFEFDVKSLIESKGPEPDMILETSHLGRGVRWDDDLEGRHISITSLDVKVWNISEYEKHELSDQNKFCFYSGDTNVVRWHYRLSRVGRLLKSGDISRHSMIGRDRTCYFFWHGNSTTNTEKGASALMTIELDKEKAQQVRVSERREEPCFLNIFKGNMVIMRGKRGQPSESVWKMFYIRGLKPNEASLIEVEFKVQSLRTRTAFVFINSSSHLIYVWIGSKCLEETQQIMKKAVENLINHKSSEIGLKSDVNYSVKELKEGKEDNNFWQIFSLDDKIDYRSLYFNLSDTSDPYLFSPRLFHLSSSSGKFIPKEIMCSFRSSDHLNPYPFLQEDVYGAQQPTFFLFDNESQIFLWESKFAFSADPNEESEANTTIGSVNIRWNVERKYALEFALAYCHAKNKEVPPKAHVVCAGLEPDSFCSLFPEWKYREDVALTHIEDGRKQGEIVPIQEVLTQLRNADSTQYSLEELRKRPEGLNPLCLESYLSVKDFKEAMGMSREEFYGLPAWKQTSLKKKSDLF